MYVIVKDWIKKSDNTLQVFYSTWDGRCICTKQNHKADIQAPDKSDFDKRDVHLEILKQVYNK